MQSGITKRVLRAYNIYCCALHRDAQRMTKLNWSCTSCGMSSTRRSSVQRHIDNYNIHNGLGQVVPFVEYSVGRREGKYLPQKVPQFTRSKAPFLDKIVDKITTEVENQIAKAIAKRIYDGLTATSQREFDELEKLAKIEIVHKDYYRILREMTS
jgi:hypothetical protein